MTVALLDRSVLASTATERLEAEATTLAGHVAAAVCRFLDVVAELARREAWKSWEARSMAHWVFWKCGIGNRAAQEHVRVAVALVELPETRAADPDRARAVLDALSVVMHTNDDGTVTITAWVPADVGIRAMTAIDHAGAELPHEPYGERGQRRVNGFEAVIDTYLEPDPNRPAVELVVHVDLETLCEDTPGRCELEGHPIATETARRLACDGGVRLSLDRADTVLDLGRRARFPNPALRRAVETRDLGTCRCTRHWTHGGPTDRWNLIMVCPTHHRSVHEGGWTITADGAGSFTFHDPRGHPIPQIIVPPARLATRSPPTPTPGSTSAQSRSRRSAKETHGPRRDHDRHLLYPPTHTPTNQEHRTRRPQPRP